MSANEQKVLKLRIGHRAYDVASLEEASRVYQRLRDDSGEGQSTWPQGRVGKFTISYNGRVWRGETLVSEAASPVEGEVR